MSSTNLPIPISTPNRSVNGCFGPVIDRLGITFAEMIQVDFGLPPNSIDDASPSTLQKEMESSEKKENDELWANVDDYGGDH